MKVKVMVDTNVLIYFLTDIETEHKEKIKKLFEQENKYQFVITTRILDELIFKLIIIQSGKNFKYLKDNKDVLKKYSSTIDIVKNFFKEFSFKIYEIKEKHYWKLKNVIDKYGLIGNDALTFIVMKENNLKYIATTDKDFEHIPAVNVLTNL
ncbi:PIN domain-containing protein [Persephonella sp.]|uniref:type II toxin-antitoxin system VapC family toxin n=1 Tax=Persephonella sp. TaxID=2060922 RepID=UPI0026137931|nr:PIN domain-containing protein [Persephonella sp.]